MARLIAVALTTAVLVGVAVAPTAAARPEVRLRPILSGYAKPILVTSDGANRSNIYIVEQSGTIRRASNKGGSWGRRGIFLDIRPRVLDEGERGLMGLAFHPRYEKNGRLYVFYTRTGAGDAAGDMVVSEFRRQAFGHADPASERVVMVIPNDKDQHIGGHIVFGPDGRLYVALGDRRWGGDPEENGQDKTTLYGSLLRIDPRDPDGDGPRTYRSPRGNPYVGKAGRDEIWARGLRSPWRYSFDRANGDLWLADVGQDRAEEVNRARARNGKKAGWRVNFGWDDCEANLEFELDEGDADDRCSTHKLPIHSYPNARPDGFCSVTGGHVYRGSKSPRWRGLYVAGDFCGGLFVLNQRGKRKWTRDSGVSLVSFGESVDGELFAVGYREGTIYRTRLKGKRP